MKPYIPHPLGVEPRRVVPVFIVDASAPVVSGATSSDAAVCRARWELGHLATDLVTVTSPRWLAFAVSEALAGRLPRTQCYLSPVLSGGGSYDLGRGPVDLPMIFAGDTCLPEWPDGEGCDDPDPATLPEHEILAPRRRIVVEEVLLDDFEAVDWPAIRAPGGSA